MKMLHNVLVFLCSDLINWFPSDSTLPKKTALKKHMIGLFEKARHDV